MCFCTNIRRLIFGFLISASVFVLLFVLYSNVFSASSPSHNQHLKEQAFTLSSPIRANSVKYRINNGNISAEITGEDPSLSFEFKKKLVNKHLTIHVKPRDVYRKIHIYYQRVEDKEFSQDRCIEGRRNIDEDVFAFFLPDAEYESIRVDFSQYYTPFTTITNAELTETVCVWEHLILYVIALGIVVFFLVPGIIISMFFHKDLARLNLILSPFYSVLFYLLIFLLTDGIFYSIFRTEITSGCLNLAVVILPVFLLCYLFARKIRHEKDFGSFLGRYIRCNRSVYIFFAATVMVIVFHLSYDEPQPITYYYHGCISGTQKIFGSIPHIDNLFQYCNGQIIAKHLDHNMYYGNRNMIYLMEDREILPAVLYSVFCRALSCFGGKYSSSYLIYTIFGVVLNSLILFPLYFYWKYIAKSNRYIGFLFLLTNTFFIVNLIFTWFKFAGAAFFLSGILVLLVDNKSPKHILMAGLLWAVCVNMHAGGALGLPILFLFFWALSLRGAEGKLRPTLCYLALCSIVFVSLLPWKLYKLWAPNMEDTNALLREHFLNGADAGNGALISSAILFFRKYPVLDQLSFRGHQFLESIDFSEWTMIFGQRTLSGFIHIWNYVEIYSASMNLQTLLGLMIIVAVIHSLLILLRNRKFTLVGLNSLPCIHYWIMICGICNVCAVYFLHYNVVRHDPNDPTNLPMGIIVLIQAVALADLCRRRIGRQIVSLYAGSRLIMILFSFLQ